MNFREAIKEISTEKFDKELEVKYLTYLDTVFKSGEVIVSETTMNDFLKNEFNLSFINKTATFYLENGARITFNDFLKLKEREIDNETSI